jgi:hypothetical protein
MKCSKRRRTKTNYCKCLFHTTAIFAAVLFSSTLPAVELVTMMMESQALDLDTGVLTEQSFAGINTPSEADISLAYNAYRSPHAVLVPVGPGTTMAFVEEVGFDGVSREVLSALRFSREAVDLPLEPSACVVIRTNKGMLFRIGNASERGQSVTLNYAPLD